ncbi:conserved hypothetical protein [Pyrobaculum islandicum DSM 4184]|uniref:Uncharacterized protein n=1 Tax=Pyrobaculum islandicum (strain DSM 4184 / JCM 9189 / GEO3) TaxID=384616 RepID=A1RRS6_PYRIL|nr:hypothetical protein [Pyrobaculum islandicum]ABL87658.1 conserved hypothetical protein [Pyrobaculum islandicum DSM 4184]
MSTSLLGIARDGDEYYILNITEGYKSRLVYWFRDLENRISAALKIGTSVVLLGPHGSGKSVLARYIAAKFVSEYYAVIDLGVDVVTFDNLLEILPEVPNAMGFYDPLGISFYDNPHLPRAELAVPWIRRCQYIIDRAFYLNTRDIPTLLVLPYDLFRYSPCKTYIEKNSKIVDIAEYLRNIDVPSILKSVFSTHAAALGCKTSNPDPYIDYVLQKHSDLSGVFALATYGGRLYARNRCAPYKPDVLYQDVIKELAKIYYRLYRELFFPTCQIARALAIPLLLSLQGQHIPPAIIHPLSNADRISRRLYILSRASATLDSAAREEILEELKELYQPQEEFVDIAEWASAPKESVVVESLKLSIREDRCTNIQGSPIHKIRTVYKGLMTLDYRYAIDLAKAVASIALGIDICKEDIGKYLCYRGEVPQIIIEALGGDKRITLETHIVSPTPRCLEDGIELLTQLAAVDARRAPLQCLEKFIEVLYSTVQKNPESLVKFYKLYRDYMEIVAERVATPILRKFALAHYYGVVPSEATPILKRILEVAQEDYKTVATVLASLATLTSEDVASLLPTCDCPYLRAFSAYQIARKLLETDRSQEVLKILDVTITEVKRGDPRHEYTPQFIQEVEELYRQVALELIV